MTYEAVIGEIIKIAMASGLATPLAAVVIVLAAVLIVGLRAVGFKWPSLPKGESGPANPNDETPAPGSPLNTDPANPGGGPTGGMG